MDPLGDLLHAVVAAAVGQDVQYLEVAAAQAVLMKSTVQFALRARMQRQDVPPLFRELRSGFFAAMGGTVAERKNYCIRIKCACIRCTRM